MERRTAWPRLLPPERRKETPGSSSKAWTFAILKAENLVVQDPVILSLKDLPSCGIQLGELDFIEECYGYKRGKVTCVSAHEVATTVPEDEESAETKSIALPGAIKAAGKDRENIRGIFYEEIDDE